MANRELLFPFSPGNYANRVLSRCRACNSFASFSAATKSPSITHTSSSDDSGSQNSRTLLSSPAKDCPPDVEQLGRSSWTLLHSITASYPSNPTPTDQQNVSQFMSLFSKLYPCWVCAEDFQTYMEQNKVRTESRDEFGKWMCEAHNDVNRKLGKREFDCRKWEERWRTGWKDGRCD
jgi:FAD-linked sulfhydryl oxidase